MTDRDYLFDPGATPDPEVQALERALAPLRWRNAPLAVTPRRMRAGWTLVAAGLAAAAIVVAVPLTISAVRSPRALPALAPGAVVATDGGTAARIRLGTIGHADVAPGSRVRVLRASAGEQRLALDRGTIRADVDAPPREFIVETPGAVAIDLGCAYTLTVDSTGRGLLRVDDGEVELARGAIRTWVVAGNVAALMPGGTPGLPLPRSAPRALREAVAAYDARPARATVDAVLRAADGASTITLWHLLGRVEPVDRARVYDRLAALAPPPAWLDRAAVLAADGGALNLLRNHLEPGWTNDAAFPRRYWLALRELVSGQ